MTQLRCAGIVSPMNTTFTSTVKRTNAGKRIAYTVFADGVEIGSRSTSRPTGFKFAVVCRSNYAHTCARAKESLKYTEGQVAKYEGYLASPDAALAAEKNDYHRKFLATSLENGTVAKWLAESKQSVEAWKKRIEELSGMTQDSPEFSKWVVYAFSNTGKDTPKDWQFGFQFVTLAQPQ